MRSNPWVSIIIVLGSLAGCRSLHSANELSFPENPPLKRVTNQPGFAVSLSGQTAIIPEEGGGLRGESGRAAQLAAEEIAQKLRDKKAADAQRELEREVATLESRYMLTVKEFAADLRRDMESHGTTYWLSQADRADYLGSLFMMKSIASAPTQWPPSSLFGSDPTVQSRLEMLLGIEAEIEGEYEQIDIGYDRGVAEIQRSYRLRATQFLSDYVLEREALLLALRQPPRSADVQPPSPATRWEIAVAPAEAAATTAATATVAAPAMLAKPSDLHQEYESHKSQLRKLLK